MTKNLAELLERARSVTMSPKDMEEQRRSFAYGSAKIENNDITRQMIDDAAKRVSNSNNDG